MVVIRHRAILTNGSVSQNLDGMDRKLVEHFNYQLKTLDLHSPQS